MSLTLVAYLLLLNTGALLMTAYLLIRMSRAQRRYFSCSRCHGERNGRVSILVGNELLCYECVILDEYEKRKLREVAGLEETLG